MNTENTTPTADSGRLPDAARYPAMAGIPETSEGEVIYVHSEQCRGWCEYACNGAEGDRLAAAMNAAARHCPDNARSAAARDNTQPHETDGNSNTKRS